MQIAFLRYLIFIYGIFGMQILHAQQSVTAPNIEPGISELVIPASPIFDLMGVTPSQVVHYSEIKNFKVDWSFRNWRINPNISLQAQPFWELMYKKKNIEKYQNASGFMRSLASLDISVGSVAGESNLRRFGGSIKVNIYSQKDPLLLKNAYNEIEQDFDSQKLYLVRKSVNILRRLNITSDENNIDSLNGELNDIQYLLNTLIERKQEAINLKARKYISENWNAAYFDIAVGWIRSYSTDSLGLFKFVQLGKNSGSAIWLNGGVGIGKHGLITGLVRGLVFKDGIDFEVENSSTGEVVNQRVNILNQLISVGVNYRIGGPKFNFFTEVFINVRVRNDPQSGIQAFDPENPEFIPIENSEKWTEINEPYAVSIGGDWRTSRNVVINFGLKTAYNNNWKMTSFIPVATIGCLMR